MRKTGAYMIFTVITVCLNGEETIERTIKSVLNQQGVEVEYVIIDGGSTDNTVKIIKKYESKIAYWCSEPDGGIYEAMNKGISVARGDVISFINSDDWYAEGALACVQQKMLEDEYDLVCGKVAHVKNGVVVEISTKSKDETELYYKMFYQHQGIFAKRSVFSKFGNFDVQYRICADYDWLLRVYNKGVRIGYVDTLVSYFSRGGVSSGFKLLEEKKAVCLKHLPTIWHDKYYHEIVERYNKGVLKHKFHYVLIRIQSDQHLAKAIEEALPIEDKCSLFGTGAIARQCCELLSRTSIKIEHIYDNDRNKQGKEFWGTVVEDPDYIKQDEIVIIGTTIYEDEIKKQLIDRSIMNNIEFSGIMEIVVSCAETIKGSPIDLEEIENV